MNKMLSVLFLSFVLSGVSFAEKLQLKDTAIKPEISNKVAIASSVVEQVTGENKTLTLVGAGMRRKTVVVDLDIYVLQFFAEKAGEIQKDEVGALETLSKAGVVALRLSFVYGVSSKQIVSAFTESLQANLKDDEMDNEDIQEFLNVTVKNSGSMPNKSNLNIIGYSQGGKEYIAYENNGKLITQEGKTPNFIKKIFSIWLGKINESDSHLLSLKHKLLGI